MARSRSEGEVKIAAIVVDEILTLPIGSIDTATFNPVGRDTGPSIARLAELIQQVGQLNPVIVIPHGHRFVMVDGHRRRAALLSLNATHIRCQVIKAPIANAPLIWAIVNNGIVKINARQWMEAWFLSDGSMDGRLPPTVAQDVKACLRIFGGKAGIEYLIEHKTAPSVARSIYQLRARFAEVAGSMKSSGVHTERRIGEWLVKHRGEALLRPWISASARGKLPADVMRKIHTRISRDEPFTAEDFIKRRATKDD